MTVDQADTILAYLMSAYPQRDVGSETLKVYRHHLLGLDYAAVQAAAMAHVETSQWFPTVAELRAYVATGGEPNEWDALEEAQRWVVWEREHDTWRADRHDPRTQADIYARQPHISDSTAAALARVGRNHDGSLPRRDFLDCYRAIQAESRLEDLRARAALIDPADQPLLQEAR